MGTRKEPLQFVCRGCGGQCETRNTGNKGEFCGKPCRANFERKGSTEPRRYQQDGHWILCWTEPGGTKRRPVRRFEFEHVRVWRSAHGEIPAGFIVHHVNHDGLDNRVENLCLMQRREHAVHHLTKYASDDERRAEYAKRARERRAARKMAK